MEKSNTWGGKRKGAGRKGFCENGGPVCWYVSEEAKNWMKQQAKEQGVSIGAVLDVLIASFKEQALAESE